MIGKITNIEKYCIILFLLTLVSCQKQVESEKSEIKPIDEYGAYSVKDLTKKPVEIKRVSPVYPAEAKQQGLEGSVIVKVLHGLNGKVERVEILKGMDVFNDAAVEAAKQFEFIPGEVNGKPVKCWISIPFNFRLKKIVPPVSMRPAGRIETGTRNGNFLIEFTGETPINQ